MLGHSADALKYEIAAVMPHNLCVSAGEGMSRRMWARSLSSSAIPRNGVRLLTDNAWRRLGVQCEGAQVLKRIPMLPRMC
ncbi:GTP cyclohydrolase II [Tilletia horrida]|uniref:GTP cyclohydrolase II n=1 Tax=Tilletia horrida TaxID=155126 RepID=A0AAN6G5R3_9BASI|nr:GTP cyclohydrolase II [Tilletia horrida]